jgi:hypothetical protein
VPPALARLPARRREVLVLRYYAGLSEAEIAATLGISTGTVPQRPGRPRRARAWLIPLTAAACVVAIIAVIRLRSSRIGAGCADGSRVPHRAP